MNETPPPPARRADNVPDRQGLALPYSRKVEDEMSLKYNLQVLFFMLFILAVVAKVAYEAGALKLLVGG